MTSTPRRYIDIIFIVWNQLPFFIIRLFSWRYYFSLKISTEINFRNSYIYFKKFFNGKDNVPLIGAHLIEQRSIKWEWEAIERAKSQGRSLGTQASAFLLLLVSSSPLHWVPKISDRRRCCFRCIPMKIPLFCFSSRIDEGVGCKKQIFLKFASPAPPPTFTSISVKTTTEIYF